ncbi:MAG: hypothetical protein ACTHN5_15670 [Phycisphaerae bacterium]
MRFDGRHRTVLGIVLFVPLAALLLLMFACLPAPVGDPASSKVDSALSGAWKATDPDGKTVLALVRPWDEHTYYVEYMAQSKKDGKEENGVLHFKAWLTPLGGATFITLEPLDRLDYVSKDEDDKAWWMTAKIDLKPGTLSFRPINPDSSLVKELDTRQKLEEVIKNNVDREDLYSPEMQFQKLASDGKLSDSEKQLIKDALEVFHVMK